MTIRACRDQNNCKTIFIVFLHTVDPIFGIMPTSYSAPRARRTTFHYKVKERELIKTAFALTIDSAMSCMRNVLFILQNRRYLGRKKLVVTMLMLQLSDLFLFDAYSGILSLELGRMRNGVLYPIDPLAQPIRFHSNCWQSDTGQDTFFFRHRFRHADFYDVLRAFNLVDITLPDPFLRMRVGRAGHYSYFPCDVCDH